MSSDELDDILDTLEASGLAEVYLDQDGHEVMRLTEAGASLARELGIFEHGDDRPDVPADTGPVTPALDLRNTWASAAGAAMLGFEQALRSEPPPEIQAADHVPERGLSGDDAGVIIEFPGDDDRQD